METTTERLQRLRVWYVAYSLFNLVFGTWASVMVVATLRRSDVPFQEVLESVPDGAIIAWSLFVGGAVLALGLLLFHHLVLRKPWARVIMLVIAWLTGISSLLSLISSCGLYAPSGWLMQIMPGVDWAMVGLFSTVANLSSLAFSVYTIRVLQFDDTIRQEFLQAGQAPG
jgi:hypothetical protein